MFLQADISSYFADNNGLEEGTDGEMAICIEVGATTVFC